MLFEMSRGKRKFFYFLRIIDLNYIMLYNLIKFTVHFYIKFRRKYNVYT